MVHGARAYLRVVDKKTDGKIFWARRLQERRHINVVAVALAAKHAQIAWAMLAKGTEYRQAGTGGDYSLTQAGVPDIATGRTLLRGGTTRQDC